MENAPSYEHYVLVSLDTLRSDGIAANPYKLWPLAHEVQDGARTTFLDQMVAEGAFFPNCISTAPYTSASHASIFTGKWPVHHNVFEFFNRRLRGNTVFTWARRLGLRTYFKTDFPIILGQHLGFTDDVDEYVVEDDERFLKLLDPRQPSLSLVHFGGIHVPYGFHNLKYSGDAYRQRVAELESDLGPGYDTQLNDRLVETYRSGEDLELMLRYKRILLHYYENKNFDKIFSLYLAGITHFMETRFAPFMERLVAKLDGRRALFVIYGDHGEEYDAHSYGHFNSVAEGVIRVPLLFWGPDVVAGTHSTRVRTVDIAPTLRECLNARAAGLDGSSLAATVFGGESYPARTAYCQTYVADTAKTVQFQERVLRTGRKTGSLPHVCYRESVYEDDFKLSRQNYEYVESDTGMTLARCEPRIALERIGSDLIPRPVSWAPEQASLIRMLDSYGKVAEGTQKAKERSDPEVTDAIRVQLRNMGYDI